MVDMSSRVSIKARFHELGAQREAKLVASAPLRAKRDIMVAKHKMDEEALNEQIRLKEVGLYEIDIERGMLARAVGGQTGEPT